MGHLLFAACTRQDPVVRRLEAAVTAATEEETGYARVSLLDLDEGPRIGRVRAALGIGWQAPDRLRRVAVETGRPVEAVIEVCLCGAHHLLALGRTVAAVRWRPVPAERIGWLDRLAAAEGVALLTGDDLPATADDGDQVARLLAALDAAREEGGARSAASGKA